MAQRLGKVLQAIRKVPQLPKQARRIISYDRGPIRLFVQMTIRSIQDGPFNNEGSLPQVSYLSVQTYSTSYTYSVRKDT